MIYIWFYAKFNETMGEYKTWKNLALLSNKESSFKKNFTIFIYKYRGSMKQNNVWIEIGNQRLRSIQQIHIFYNKEKNKKDFKKIKKKSIFKTKKVFKKNDF